MAIPFKLSTDNIELQFATNHIGTVQFLSFNIKKPKKVLHLGSL